MESLTESMRGILRAGIEEGVYPGAVLLVARAGEVLAHEAAGYCSLDGNDAVELETIFDLASLTKPLATALAAMYSAEQGMLSLDTALAELWQDDLPPDKGSITPRQLLSHCAGMAPWKPFYLQLEGLAPELRKQRLWQLALAEPLSYVPGSRAVYRDLGFMVLEALLAKTHSQPLHQFLSNNLFEPWGLQKLFLDQGPRNKDYPLRAFAATENCPWRRAVVRGRVHDENAFAAGGYSGHAGLFGTATAVFKLAARLRDIYLGLQEGLPAARTVREFFARQQNAPDSTWALGWDTPSAGKSSAGRHFSRHSVGHLGFTGTSLWMDLEKDVIVVLLTNRIHPNRRNEKIREFRPRLHDLVMESLGLAA